MKNILSKDSGIVGHGAGHLVTVPVPAHKRRRQRSVLKSERTFAFDSLYSLVGLLKSRFRDNVRVLMVILLAGEPVPNLA